MTQRLTTYRAFWPYYLAAHSQPATRLLHGIGTTAGLVLAAAGIAAVDWRLAAAALVAGYAFAWIGHFAIEGNRPATFTYPLWSLVSDVRMLGLWLIGGLAAELTRHRVAAPH